MPLKPIILQLRAQGTQSVQSEVRGVKDELRGIAGAANDAGMQTRRAFDSVENEARTSQTALRGVAREMENLAREVPGATAFSGLRNGISSTKNDLSKLRAMMASVRNAGDGGPNGVDLGLFQSGGEAAERLKGQLDGVRNAGLAIGAAGIGGLMLSESLAKAGRDAVESENLIKESFGSSLGEIETWSRGLRESLGVNDLAVRKNAGVFNVMFNSMKIGAEEGLDMSKSLTTLAMDMASFYNLSDDEAFEKLRAGITGEAEPLKALGILIDENTVKNYAYAKGIAAAGKELTEQQKVLARYGAIMEQTQKAQGDMARTLDSPANIRRRAEAQAQMGREAVGRGAADAQASVDGLKTKLSEIVALSPGLAYGAGQILTYGSYAATGVGSLTAFGAQLTQLYLGYKTMQMARMLDTIAQGANTTATNINTAAQNTNAASATVTASAQTSAGVAAAGAGNAAATGARGWIAARMAVLGTTAAAIGVGVAAAVAAGYIAYSAAQNIGWLDKEQSFVERLASGWERLKNIVSGTKAEWGQNEKDLAAEIAKVESENAEAVLKGKKTQEQADKDVAAEKARLHEQFAREQLRIGDKENMTKNQQEAARLKEQIKAQDTAKNLVVPSIPSVPASLAAPDAGTTGAAAKLAGLKVPNLDGIAREKQQVELDKIARDSEITRAMMGSAYDEQIEKLEDELEKARENRDKARVERLTYEIEKLRAEKKHDDAIVAADVAQKRDGDAAADHADELARIEYEADMRRAKRAAARAGREITRQNRGDVSPSDGANASDNDAQTRALLAMQNAVAMGDGAPVNALGANINYGDRFTGMAPSRFADALMPLPLGEALAASSAPRGGSGSGASRRREIEETLGVDSMRQNARGDVEITLKTSPIVVPYSGIGSLRGGIR